MTTIALDCELLAQLRRSAGDVFSWSQKAKAVLVGDALAEVKERMATMAEDGSPAPKSAKEAASAAFQSLVRDVPREKWESVALDEESISVAIGLQVYYSVLVEEVSPEKFDGYFNEAWRVYLESVKGWIA